jgi:sugar/nucleoside kinase (ribokinase family)
MTDSTYDVLGIGNAIVDVLSRVDDDFLIIEGLVKGTMRLIDEADAERLYAAMGPAVEVSGGSVANTVAGIASFGGDAAFIGRVKNDQLGEVFTHDIRAAGVTFDTPAAGTGPATARCLVMVTPEGERTMNTYLGASVALSPDDIEPEVIAAAAVTYLEGYLWDPPGAKAAFLKAARSARAAGRLTALSLSDPFCVERHRESFLDLIGSGIDIVFANEAEITSLYRVETFDEALQAVRTDCKLAVLTRSAAGSVIVEGDEVHVVEAVKVPGVVDATGAGDLFAAGFLFGYTRGRDLASCARLGALAASEVISHIGARPQLPLAKLAAQAGLL